MSSTITIDTNLASLNAQRRLGDSTASLRLSYERLSSGLRINRASDDATGLAIASGLNADARVYSQGIRNLNDGQSAFSIAEGAVTQLSDIVTRIKELAEESSNGTISDTQRISLNAEAQALSSEYNRIVNTTQFNGQNLIDGTLQTIVLQNGYGANGELSLPIGQQLARGVGDGTFQAGASYAGDSTDNESVITGDFTGNGKIDIVSVGHTTGVVNFLAGNGDGTFLAPVTYAAGPSTTIQAGDLNHDGKLDLVLGGVGGGRAGVRFGVLLGNGDGTFKAATNVVNGLGATYGDVQLADVNGDGNLDVISTDNGTLGTGPVTTAVYLGVGDGTFGSPIVVTSDGGYTGTPSSVVGDLNGDGNADIVSGYTGKVYFGTGTGTFSFQGDYSIGRTVSLADLTGDGKLDIISNGFGNVAVSLNNGDGTFLAPIFFAGSGAIGQTSEVDVNGDGKLDIIASDGANIYTYLGNGDGMFKAPTSVAVASGSGLFSLGDLTGNGSFDIAAATNTGNIDVIEGNDTKSNTIVQIDLSTQASSVAAVDLLTTALNRVTSELGSLGASESRISFATAAQQQLVEYVTKASAQLMDVDVAQESATVVRSQILQQTGAAILAQANQQPALALRLLQGI